MSFIITSSWFGDDLSFAVTVLDSNTKAAKPIDGAIVVARAKMGSAFVDGSAIITDSSAGKITVVFADSALAVGVWRIQVRVTIGAETQTVYEGTHEVRLSVF